MAFGYAHVWFCDPEAKTVAGWSHNTPGCGGFFFFKPENDLRRRQCPSCGLTGTFHRIEGELVKMEIIDEQVH